MKNPKVYWNDKRVKNWGNQHGHISLFKRFTNWCKRALFNLGIVGAFVAVVAFIFMMGGVLTPRSIATPVLFDNLTPKIEDLKNDIVDDIQKCESRGHAENDGIIIFDSNDEASIGNLQFQRKTVIHYEKVLFGKTVTPKQAILIALDQTEARELAKKIIFEDSKGWKNWYNCGRSMDVEARLKVIKELSQ